MHGFIAVLFSMTVATTAGAQTFADRLQQTIEKEEHVPGIRNFSQVASFYRLMGFKPVWLGKENTENLVNLQQMVSHSSALGLEERDYYSNNISPAGTSPLVDGTIDSVYSELQHTDLAIRFLKDRIYGNQPPDFGYDGLKYQPDITGIPSFLVSCLAVKLQASAGLVCNDELPEVVIIEQKLQQLQSTLSGTGFEEVKIVSQTVGAKNKPLVTKLYQLGILDTASVNLADSLVKQKLKVAQRMFDLYDDGTLRPTSLEQLNVPLTARFQQLKIAINYYRWLHGLVQKQVVIVVNIPAAFLKVYQDNKTLIGMRMIVGKKSTPTPTLTSRVNQVVLYPYWNVPRKIAVKELLPSIQKNPGFVAAGDFQILNNSGKVIDPYSVDWSQVNASNFGYTIRQSTGCDNALGLLKLDFYNPYGVYLHDTPAKELFMLNRRYFSHGCMRMEMPLEIGHMVLKNNQVAIDTLTVKGCLRNKSPIYVPADVRMPVVVWYNPVGIDSSGQLVFYYDVYGKFGWMNRKK